MESRTSLELRERDWFARRADQSTNNQLSLRKLYAVILDTLASP